MDYKLECQESEGLTIESIQNGDSSFDVLDIQPNVVIKNELGNESADDVSSIADFQSATTADDLLQNGILVETNKGLVCMSLKDVLSSNLNLSVEDFQNVAAQLLSEQSITGSNSTSSTKVTEESESSELETQSSKMVTVTTIPSQNDPCQSVPITMEISYKSNIGSSSDESTNVTYTSDILLVENLDQNISLNINNESATVDGNQSESQSFSSSPSPFDLPETGKDKTAEVVTKRRGGWPKGRKRKPELLNLPPKAPKTSYNIFLNERRKLYKDKLAFHEITRVVGNQWSNLSSEEKQPYIEKAEEDKKRYREELLKYRQSDVYQLYLARKRKKRAMDNLLSESDMDGTDDIEDEHDTLYCDMCDQWFYNLHNKREHLLSRQHKMLVAGDMTKELASSDSEYKGHISSVSFSTSLDESSLDATSVEPVCPMSSQKKLSACETVSDFMSNLFSTVTQREKEIKILQVRLNESASKKSSFLVELSLLKDKANAMKNELSSFKEQNNVIELQIYQLWQTIFLVNSSSDKKP